jgi:hypothetical protein
MWGCSNAQIFSDVSPEMHWEFGVRHDMRWLERWGMTYYGCCEPLHNKIDIIQRIPNLRKISITPWADVDLAADAINTKYVLSSKPNPAKVAVGNLDTEDLKKEIGKILDACKRNHCNVDIVLKDISSCNGRPENIFSWESLVMDMVRSF